MPRLLVVHHTPSPTLDTMLRRVLDGAGQAELADVEVLHRPALGTTVTDVLDADGYIVGTPANLGYMSGALKHFFDTIYYPCLTSTTGRPWGLYVHGNDDVDGAVDAARRIVTGLAWKTVSEPVRCTGELTTADRDACWELGAVVAASLLA